MLAAVARRLAGDPSRRAARAMRREVEAVAALEPSVAALSDSDLAAQTVSLRKAYRDGASLDALLPRAFAVAREAARRVLGQRPYDVQVMGGIVLHRGKVAEMKTGEGKTLVAVLPAYLNALSGDSVHVVTVNDYLARRDAEEMGRVFGFLGLAVGCIVPGMADDERRLAYACDVTYAVNSEIGFDYLRDNMKMSRPEMVHRPFGFAIVDEVDSVLIDEARTPLILSGQGPDTSGPALLANQIVAGLAQGDWEADAKMRTVHLTERGLARVEEALRACKVLSGDGHLYDGRHSWMVSFVHQALRAWALFELDRHYVVHDGKIVIVDEHTGRMMDGRRYSDGLHQALEAKHGLFVLPDNQTLAAVTYQNFFRLYPKLSGMTGTAASDADELAEFYGLEVVQVPTNRPVARVDHEDEIYRTAEERDDAVVALVREAHGRGQPVLVGTSSIERSEHLSRLFAAAGLPHAVLNARQHAQEARIVAQAGRPGAITIATNMAGRGTDIKLGGSVEGMIEDMLPPDAAPELRDLVSAQLRPQVEEDAALVRAAGGLFVVGTERHESRRVDDQLRGRSGRQGDPGASKFLVSLEDDLMRRFGGERLGSMLAGLGLTRGEPIVHRWVSRAVRKAQEQIEGRHFETRRTLIQYDAIINGQRKAFYGHRAAVMDEADTGAAYAAMTAEAVAQVCARAMPGRSYPEQWDLAGLAADVARWFNLDLPVAEWAGEEGVDAAAMERRVLAAVQDACAARFVGAPPEFVAAVQRNVLLQALDRAWQGHMAALEHLREGISLRSYAQRNPLHEWHTDATTLFEEMLSEAAECAVVTFSRVSAVSVEPTEADGGCEMAAKA